MQEAGCSSGDEEESHISSMEFTPASWRKMCFSQKTAKPVTLPTLLRRTGSKCNEVDTPVQSDPKNSTNSLQKPLQSDAGTESIDLATWHSMHFSPECTTDPATWRRTHFFQESTTDPATWRRMHLMQRDSYSTF